MKSSSEIYKIAGSIFGISVVFCLYLFVLSFGYNKNTKFYRCKQIEVILGMKQHLTTDPCYKEKKRIEKVKKPIISKGTTIFQILLFIIIIFFAFWIGLLLS